MPDYQDPLGAAQSRFIPGANQTSSGTDVWHDRNWLMANASGGNRRMARAAIVALRDLDRQQALAQRSDALQQRGDIAQQGLNLRGAALDQHSLEFEANQRRQMAHDAATESHKQLTTDRDTEIDEQGHGLLQSMLQLDGALRRGDISKDQYDQGLLDAGSQYPLGTRHPEAARHYNFAITEADKQNDFNARQQFREAAKIGAKYGIGVQANPDTGLPSVEHTQLAALQTDKGKLEATRQMNQEMLQKYGVATGVGSLFNPIAPHVGTDATGAQVDNPTHIALPFQDQKTGATGHVNVPMPLFDQMKSDFNDRYFTVNPPSAQQPAGAANTGAQQPAAPAAPQIPTIGSADEYQALPAGSTFISGGKQFQKPAEQAQ